MLKGTPLTLGDGKEYVIAPLSLGALEDYGEAIKAMGNNALDPATIKLMIDVVHASLRRNYPEMTRDMVRELIDISNALTVFQACMNVSGLTVQAAASGEAKRPVRKARQR